MAKRKFFRTALLVLSLSVPNLALAYCPNLSGENESEVIAALLDSDREILGSIPRLSPREEEWLDGELNSGDGKRRFAAWDSVEWAQRKAISTLEYHIELFEGLQSNLARGEGNVAWAIYDWSALVRSYISHNYYNHLAKLVETQKVSLPKGAIWEVEGFRVSEMLKTSCTLMAGRILQFYVLKRVETLL